MDPLQLFTAGPAALATVDESAAPLVAVVQVTEATPTRLSFELGASPVGRSARARAQEVVTAPLGAHRFERWAEARGTLDAQGLAIASLSHGGLELGLGPQDRARLLAALWDRGLPSDARAVDVLRDAFADTPTPAFLAASEGLQLRATLTHGEKEQAVNLLVGTYWNEGVPRERVAAAVHAATVNVGARDAEGRLVAHARAMSDRTKYAWIYDVVVDPPWRGKGVGQAVMRFLLAHPLVRDAHQVLLATRDAQPLYARFGFRDRKEVPPLRSWASTEMVLRRAR